MRGETRRLNRREVIRRLVGAGFVTVSMAELADAFASANRSSDGALVGYRRRFFMGSEYETMARLASLIIPSDETPGAREARVEEWIDFLVSESDAIRQRLYREGLACLADRCRERSGSDFLSLAEPAQLEILRDLSEADTAFFRALKEDTVFGFYTSEIGLRELDWGGQSFHSECPGCTHPSHLNWAAPSPGPSARR